MFLEIMRKTKNKKSTCIHDTGCDLNWNPQARGREEDQRRPGGGQLWKRHREKEGRGGR
jgi:hypothetical protein